MASNSGRKSGSSGRSTPRKRVVIGAEETVRVRYRQNKPEVESERRSTRLPRHIEKQTRNAAGGAGKRLSHVKREERERRQQLTRLKRGALIVAAFLALVLAVSGLVALYRAPIFTIDNVVVEGNARLSPDQVIQRAGIPESATLLRLSPGDVEVRLEGHPWIAEATVDRDFPSTLRIAVKERRPALVVDQGGTDLWVVSVDGHWLGRRAGNEGELIVVRDIEALSPRAGARVTDSSTLNALAVIEGLSDELRKKVESISAPSVDETALRTAGDVEVFVGEATEMTEKDRVIREILSSKKGVVYINVRVVDRPTWRGLGGD